jgi:hypothetical protein
MTHLNMDALPESQRNVLNAIAINEDAGHSPRTLKALEDKGLIVGHTQTLAGTPPVKVTRWEVPLAVHVQWAEWCSRQVEEDGQHPPTQPPDRLPEQGTDR